MNNTNTESIQSLIITGYTIFYYVYSNDINLPLVLSTIMYMIIY